MQSLAVDIARIYQPNIEEELWKRYYAGDHGAFMRYLGRSLTKQNIASIRDLSKKIPNLGVMSPSFMAEF